MKQNRILLAFVILLFSGCAMHNGLTYNVNQHNTEVVLSKNNFKVIDRVKGKSTATYVLGIGGLTKNALIAEAKEKMLSKANIIGGPRAIVNETVEIKNAFYLFFWVKKVTVSANIVEFFNEEYDIKTSSLDRSTFHELRALKDNGLKEDLERKESGTSELSEDSIFKVGDRVKFNNDVSNNISFGKVIEVKSNSILIEYNQMGKKVQIEKPENEVWLR